ncbi:MAG: methyltransferase domain-containing protein [Chryseolinea sp.]
MSSEWATFWKDQDDAFDSIMQINTEFFADQLRKKYLIRPGMEILDYGCGPGLMIDVLAFDHKLTGVDINGSFIGQCQLKHPKAQFIEISDDPETTKAILDENLRGKQFDIVVALSILQYFQDLSQVEALLALLNRLIKVNGKVILADVSDENSNSMADAGSLLLWAFRKRKVRSFIGFINYLMTSEYRKISREHKLLMLSEGSVKDLALKTGFSVDVVNGLTIHPSRTNYVLTRTG